MDTNIGYYNCEISLYNLPTEILARIFSNCDVKTLGRLSRTCHRFRNIIYDIDTIWRLNSFDIIGSNIVSPAMEKRCQPVLSYFNRCKLADKWTTVLGKTYRVCKYKKCMPWIQLERESVFFSTGHMLSQYKRRPSDGDIHMSCSKITDPIFGDDDISKFCVTETEVVCAGSGGQIARLEKEKFNVIVNNKFAHTEEVYSVSSAKETIISGSKDGFVKIWKSNDNTMECRREICVMNRVFATALLPSNDAFTAGNSGMFGIPPLELYDLESGYPITTLGGGDRYCVSVNGVKDIFVESPYTLYSCGYDASVKMWDIRTPRVCVARFVDPFDYALFCVQSDYHVTILAGKCSDGSFLIFDKRYETKPVRTHHVPKKLPRKQQKARLSYQSGPLYSIAFDATHIYTGFEDAVYQFSYSCCLKSRMPCEHCQLMLPFC